jgi:hypothetical protein
MLTLLLWRLICTHLLGAHTRDWYLWDSQGIARCLHCRRPMPEPSQQPRHKL